MSLERQALPEAPGVQFHLTRRHYGYRAPRSPDNGAVVELFPGVFHARPITDDMLDGTKLSFDDFKSAAADVDAPRRYPGAAAHAFHEVFWRQRIKAERTLGLYGMNSPFYDYDLWGAENQSRRSQLLLATQAVYDTYTLLKNHPDRGVRHYKFLGVYGSLFEAGEPPELSSPDPPYPNEDDMEHN